MQAEPEGRTAQVLIHTTEPLKRQLRIKAAQAGKSMSAWTHDLLERELTQPQQPTADHNEQRPRQD